MVFANLDDETGSVELVVFPRLYSNTKTSWVEDQPILITGKVDFKDRLAIIVDSAVQPQKESPKNKPEKHAKSNTYAIVLQKDSPKDSLVKINQLLQANQGLDRVMIKLKNGQETSKMIEIPYTVDFASIKSQIQTILKTIDGKLVVN